jgi:hypothetical protein
MKNIVPAVVRTPILGSILLLIFRAKIALGYFYRTLSYLIVWLFKSRESTNVTYDLEENNKRYLASLIADVTDKDFYEIANYIREIEEDNELTLHVQKLTKQSHMAFKADKEVHLGRRIGWYAFMARYYMVILLSH